jgi:hypothetical protein
MTRSKFSSLQALLLTGSVSIGMSGLAEAQEAKEEEKTAEVSVNKKSWTDDFTVGMFVDAYGALRSDRNSHGSGPVTAGAATAGYYHEAYTQAEGFALAFAGADLAYSGEKFGATVSLRFGPGVKRFYAADNGPLGLDYITQAYATWKPVKDLTLDFGQFYTIYGAEVAESWRNMNYSRGGLYYAMQPFWHTGLRANYKINDVLSLNGLVVNAVNTAYENNKSPSLGIQALVTPTDGVLLALGYLAPVNPRAGGEENSTLSAFGAFEHFMDFVGTATVGDFKLVTNADLNLYKAKGATSYENWWGVSVAPGYSFTNWFGCAARVEYLSDSANTWSMTTKSGDLAGKAKLTTLTGTLDFKPVPNSAAVVLRPEFRYELASSDYFQDNDNAPSKKFWSAHLGVVVTSMP